MKNESKQSSPLRSGLLFLQILLAIVPICFVAFALIFRPGLLTGVAGGAVVIGPSHGSRIMITNAIDGAPRVLLYDANNNAPLTMELTPTGVPMIHMDSQVTGKRAIEISTALSGGRPHIMLFNPETGSPAWSVKINKDGKPVITDYTAIED